MPEGKYFVIRSRLNGLVLDIYQNECSPGQKVVTYGAKPPGDNLNQTWFVDALTRTIRSRLDPGYCMDTDEDGTLIVNPYSDSDSQRWKISGDRVQRHSDPNMVLDIAENNEDEEARVIQYEFHGGDNQAWDIECEQPEYFFLRSAMHGKVLDVCAANPDEGTQVIVYGRKENPEDNQLWYEDKYGYIRSKLNNMVLDATHGDMCLHTHDTGSDRQRWVYSEGKIINVDRPEEVVDIKGRNEGDGANIIPWRAHGGDNQQWERDFV